MSLLSLCLVSYVAVGSLTLVVLPIRGFSANGGQTNFPFSPIASSLLSFLHVEIFNKLGIVMLGLLYCYDHTFPLGDM